jgi:hypothetical protein
VRDETRCEDFRTFEFPRGVQRYALRRCGLSVTLPQRFVPLPTPSDPLARRLEEAGLDAAQGVACNRPDQRRSFYDPAIYRIHRQAFYPLRTVEFLAWRWPRINEVDPELSATRRGLPPALEMLQLPGYRFGDVRTATLAGSPALRLEYTWDGLRDRVDGGAHALTFAIPCDDRLAFVFYQCPGDHWDAWKDGLETILASLRLIELEGGRSWFKA